MFELPDLPYEYIALEPYIDEQTMRIHHDKHHGTYVTNLNDALKGQDKFLNMTSSELMKSLDQVPADVKMKVRNNGGGHINHTFFWEIMGSGKGGEPSGKVAEVIKSTFGDFGKFQEAFSKAGVGRFGSGWAWLVASGGKLTITDTPNQDNPWMENKTPILGIDVWEHAYYLKYQNKRADYIKAWWNVVNWGEVEKRFSALQ
ncbi:superoxide dismutase [Candidatus Gottesmanbacteria bacterium RIFCSPHIGHO2_01_FULL_39_10]|uniref:Superoxide dismutase n=1 Tax=Candidatus Gottesmanbacteria bacterium RIFCSPHIGHO2_01_FULL_39_10 TaxID=1798375 RepID=A0A1F5ZPV5_9BACT|nr:MAG: superoxide dismutase [Candidatus Gottesmanbacteria bacterium RIFCSPHIGHO2_01_FULL_39_10]